MCFKNVWAGSGSEQILNWTLPPASLQWLRRRPGKRNVKNVSTEIPLSHQGVLLSPNTAQVDSISTEAGKLLEKLPGSKSGISEGWASKSSEALLCLKKHLKWKIKGQTLMSLIILIWINSYWHSKDQQTRTSEPGPERAAETHPKYWSLLGLEITWTFPVPRRARITTRTNFAEVILTLLFPVSAEPKKNTDVHKNNNKQRMTTMGTPCTLASSKLLSLWPEA